VPGSGRSCWRLSSGSRENGSTRQRAASYIWFRQRSTSLSNKKRVPLVLVMNRANSSEVISLLLRIVSTNWTVENSPPPIEKVKPKLILARVGLLALDE
jgi:hypothetical protein